MALFGEGVRMTSWHQEQGPFVYSHQLYFSGTERKLSPADRNGQTDSFWKRRDPSGTLVPGHESFTSNN